MSVKKYAPWWAKLVAKLVLSRTPVGYGVWRRLGLFLHGAMETPEYVCGVLASHMQRLGWKDLRGKVLLEIGPGDSLSSALVSRTFGAAKIYLVDTGSYASYELAPYHVLYEYLVHQDLRPPVISHCRSIPELLTVCHGEYLTRGLQSLRQIPDASVDFVFSQAVLEHIRLRDLPATLLELRRVVSPTGIASHEVDLKDHLGGSLNNLRFSDRVWESEFMARSGFYTNRLRYIQMLELFRETGYEPEVVDVRRWDRLPIDRAKLAARFRLLSEEDLLVSQFGVLARPVEPAL